MTRTYKDINTVTIEPSVKAPNEVDAWRVFLLYNDGKYVNFWVDVGDKEYQMLREVSNAIDLQLVNG